MLYELVMVLVGGWGPGDLLLGSLEGPGQMPCTGSNEQVLRCYEMLMRWVKVMVREVGNWLGRELTGQY